LFAFVINKGEEGKAAAAELELEPKEGGSSAAVVKRAIRLLILSKQL